MPSPISKAESWVRRLEALPWAFLIFAFVTIGGLILIGAGAGLSWGEYLGAVAVAAGLHGVGHGIRAHAKALHEPGRSVASGR
jgi:hypothetical protein